MCKPDRQVDRWCPTRQSCRTSHYYIPFEGPRLTEPSPDRDRARSTADAPPSSVAVVVAIGFQRAHIVALHAFADGRPDDAQEHAEWPKTSGKNMSLRR
jgi:hypothetical protein